MSQKKSDRLDKKIKSLTDEIAQLQRKRGEILDERIIDELPMRVIDDDGKEVKIDRAQVAECIRRFFKQVSLSERTFIKYNGDGCGGRARGVCHLYHYIKKELGVNIYILHFYRIWTLVHECHECPACNLQGITASCHIPDKEAKWVWDNNDPKSRSGHWTYE